MVKVHGEHSVDMVGVAFVVSTGVDFIQMLVFVVMALAKSIRYGKPECRAIDPFTDSLSVAVTI